RSDTPARTPSIVILIEAFAGEGLVGEYGNLIGICSHLPEKRLHVPFWSRRRGSCRRGARGIFDQAPDIALRVQSAGLQLGGKRVRNFDGDLHEKSLAGAAENS